MATAPKLKFAVTLFLFSQNALLHAQVPSAAVRLETVISGLTEPTFVTHAGDGSGRLFVLEQRGRIRIYKAGQLLTTPFLDISALVTYGGERGLLGLAFHPSYKTNGRFFINYTRTSGGQLRTVIAEYRVSSSNADVADPTEKLILTFDQPFENHNGGMLAFGPEGYLYIGTGDGGSGGDPQNNGQRLDTLLAKLLRIDIDSASPYAVPRDNPFVGRAGARGEIWAYGLRNPWRFSFDRPAGRLFLADVGQDTVEEVDLVVRGGNYGWRIMEGDICFSPPSNCDQSALVMPIATYRHTVPPRGRSVTGGYVYRGPQDSPWKGAYFFGDFVSTQLWSLTENSGGTWTQTEILNTGLNISSFGEDERGELYVVNLGGVGQATGSVHRMLFGSTLVFPQVADGGGYTTTFTVTNTQLNNASATLRFFNPDGTTRQVTLADLGTASSFSFQVPAGGTRVFATTGLSPTGTVGMALLESIPPVGAVSTFRLSSGGSLRTVAAVLNSGFVRRATLPVNTVPPANTGVAIANPGSAPVNVRLTLVNREGIVVASVDLPQLNPLPPKGQVAVFVTEMGFQDSLGLSENSLQVSVQGDGQIGIVSLLQEDGLLSVVPVLPVANQLGLIIIPAKDITH
ncbi:MAG TPA: PQQ-dependent sugar dehydrogenase [Acidobacteriota bacterium]